MFFAHGRKHVNPYYNRLGILKLENICRLKVLLFTYKLKNDKSNTTAVLLNIFTPASEIHKTRYVTNQNFFKPSVRTKYGMSTFKFSAIKIWESVLNLNVFHTCYSKSGIKDSYWVLKTDHSLTVSYMRYCFTVCSSSFILTCIYVCLSSLTISMSSLV